MISTVDYLPLGETSNGFVSGMQGKTPARPFVESNLIELEQWCQSCMIDLQVRLEQTDISKRLFAITSARDNN